MGFYRVYSTTTHRTDDNKNVLYIFICRYVCGRDMWNRRSMPTYLHIKHMHEHFVAAWKRTPPTTNRAHQPSIPIVFTSCMELTVCSVPPYSLLLKLTICTESSSFATLLLIRRTTLPVFIVNADRRILFFMFARLSFWRNFYSFLYIEFVCVFFRVRIARSLVFSTANFTPFRLSLISLTNANCSFVSTSSLWSSWCHTCDYNNKTNKLFGIIFGG